MPRANTAKSMQSNITISISKMPICSIVILRYKYQTSNLFFKNVYIIIINEFINI